MKNIARILIIVLTVISYTSCYDRDVTDYKEFNHSLPKIENLSYTKQDNVVKLSWQIPANISDDFKRPLEVSIQVVENNIYKEIIIVENENASRDITIDVNKKYRFVVKLLGYLTNEAKEEGKTDKVYSQGQVVHIE